MRYEGPMKELKHSELSAASWLQTPSFKMTELQDDDLETVLFWRNKPEIRLQMLNDGFIDMDSHRQWFQSQQACEGQLQLMIRHKNTCVGVSNIKSLDDQSLGNSRQVELGLYFGDDRFRGTLLAFVPALMTINYCFKGLGCELIQARVKPANSAALRFNQALGYRITENNGLVYMQLTEDAFVNATASMQRLTRV